MDFFKEIAAQPRVATLITGTPDPNGRSVVYWMRRSQRALDNPALEIAIAVANELARPLLVFFCLRAVGPHPNLRHYAFMIEGLTDTAKRLARRRIGFVIRTSDRTSASAEFSRLCAEVHPAWIVTDENPLHGPDGWKRVISPEFPLPTIAVDADTIVPAEILGREHYAARTIRPRIHAALGRFLKPVGNRRVRVPWKGAELAESSAPPSLDMLGVLSLDRSVSRAGEFAGGTSEALARMRRFIRNGLTGYAERRNRPELDGTSRLSPYLHFGHLGPHTVALAVRDADAPEADRDAFLEELVVRRELAINFVRYNRRYRSLESCEPWALRTLREHRRDRRPYLYNERRLENAETHDELWNAAQRQMVTSGWMHGYMRMYWAKKIFEWSRSAREAYAIAVRMNDRYELDGRDPNGYAGIAWAIGGKHDRAWGPERAIYGKIRYMSAASTARKFGSSEYIARWAGKTGESNTDGEK